MKKIKKHRTLKNRLYPDIRKSPNPFSKTHILHMSIAQKGKKLSLETKLKIGMIHKGKPKSKEHKKKISMTLTGKPQPWNSGKNNIWWRGGKSDIVNKVKSSNKYKRWRSEVYKRDKYTCRKCKKKGRILNPHHIITVASIFEKYKLTSYTKAMKCKELFKVSNGKTLCRKCHKKTNSFGFNHYNKKNK